MNKKVTCIIGCGYVVKAFLDGFRILVENGLDMIEVAGACDIDKVKAESFAHDAASLLGKKPRTYRDYELMLREIQPELVLVCTPVYLHHSQSIASLESGAHVLVEKPFAATIEAAQQVINAAEREKKILTVGHKRRYALGTRVMTWAILEEKLIGEPRFFTHTFTSYNAGDPKAEDYTKQPIGWKKNVLTSGGGPLFDMGVHVSDIMLQVFGDLKTAYGKVDSFLRSSHDQLGKDVVPTEDTWMALLTFSNGFTGTWVFSSAAPGHSLSHTIYYGSDGSLSNDQFYTATLLELTRWDQTVVDASTLKEKYLDSLSEEQKETYFPRGITHPNALEIYEFVRAIEEEREPEVTPVDALKAQAFCEAIYESAYSKKEVSFRGVLEGESNEYQEVINKYIRK